jgi:hypothetical protein
LSYTPAQNLRSLGNEVSPVAFPGYVGRLVETFAGLPDVVTAYALRMLAHMLDSDCRALTRTCPARRTPHAGQKAQKVTTGTKQPQNEIGPPPKEKP